MLHADRRRPVGLRAGPRRRRRPQCAQPLPPGMVAPVGHSDSPGWLTSTLDDASRRAWNSAAKCSMTNNGTRYAGISTSGNCAMGPVVTSPAAPEARTELSPPVLTATTRSRIPSRFQTTKTRLVAKPGRRTRARATHGAVTPMAMSPRPAGQAKAPGSTPWAYRARNPSPAALHPWIAVARRRSRDRTNARKAGQPQYAPRNTRTGAVTPMRMGTGGVPGGRAIAPAAPSRKTTTNQRASTPTIIGLMVAPRGVRNGSCGPTPNSGEAPGPGTASRTQREPSLRRPPRHLRYARILWRTLQKASKMDDHEARENHETGASLRLCRRLHLGHHRRSLDLAGRARPAPRQAVLRRVPALAGGDRHQRPVGAAARVVRAGLGRKNARPVRSASAHLPAQRRRSAPRRTAWRHRRLGPQISSRHEDYGPNQAGGVMSTPGSGPNGWPYQRLCPAPICGPSTHRSVPRVSFPPPHRRDEGPWGPP